MNRRNASFALRQTLTSSPVLFLLALAGLSAGVSAQDAAMQPLPPLQELTLDAVLKTPRKFMPSMPRLSWVPGGEYYLELRTKKDGQSLIKHAVKGRLQEELLTAEMLSSAFPAEKLKSEGLSPKRLPPITALDTHTLRFPTKTAIYHWDLNKVKPKRVLERWPGAAREAIAKGDQTGVFVVDHDLVVHKADGSRRRITWDGSADMVYGGAAHRAEMGITDGLWWDPSGRFLSFSREDMREIAVYPYVDYKKLPAEPLAGRYPMAGRTHSKVSIGVYDAKTEKLIYLDHDKSADIYWTNVTFHPKGKEIYVALVNRGQNHMDLVAFDSMTGARKSVLFSESDKAWVEPEHGPIFENDEQFLWLSQRNGFNDLFRYHRNGQLIADLTQGEVGDITEVFLADDGPIYFTATGRPHIPGDTASALARATEKLVSSMDLLRVAFESNKGSEKDIEAAQEEMRKKAEAKQMTKTVEPGSGKACGMSLFRISKKLDGSWGRTQTKLKGRLDAIQFEPTRRGQGLIRSSSINSPGTLAVHWSTAHRVIYKAQNPFDSYRVGKPEHFTLTTKDDQKLYGLLVKPTDFDPSKKYPVIHYVYGGPHAQLVQNRWLGGARLWLFYMASKGYVIHIVDNRGTPNRGKAFYQSIHRQVGELEIEDQLFAIEQLKKQPWVDGDRIGVHGWSYGGYMSMRLCLKAPDVFKACVSGAPVTDWARYETGYGERYMDTPQENAAGYAAAGNLALAKNLKARLLLVHGTDDKTVMFSHSMAFLQACIDAGKEIEFMAYPMQKHGLRGKAREHFYRKMTKFFDEHL